MEICLVAPYNFGCSDKDLWLVWAAWAQGLGTVAAVFMAMWIAQRQQRAQRQAAEDQDRGAQRRAERLVALYADTIVDTLLMMADACLIGERGKLNSEGAALEDLAELGRQVRADHLTLDVLSAFLSLRTIRTRAEVALRAASQSSDIDAFEERFQGLLSAARDENLLIAAALGDAGARKAIAVRRASEVNF